MTVDWNLMFVIIMAHGKKVQVCYSLCFFIIALYFTDNAGGIKAFNISLSNTKEMLDLIRPVFVLMGLLDA